MIAKIKVLPQQEALKIAAGEVIERPAHVVKELVENALDAGATSVSVYIQKAGKELIRIIDNGCGMVSQDAHMCFLPHATSKISCMDEVERVASYGFRGEALASIAAISNVTLITKPNDSPDDALGVSITYKGGGVEQEVALACPVGTDIQIHDLFFNTPVRKKFLKQDETEWNAIQNIVYAFCFSHSHVHFKLYHDNKLMLNAPPVTTAKDRALQVWEPNIAQNLIPLHSDEDLANALRINGYISHHNFWRYGRQNIYFFVNNRWVRNTELSKAVMKGYANVLPPDRFPAAIIFVTIDFQALDINVHPKKEEVRFSKPLVVQTELMNCIKSTLEKHVSSVIGEKKLEQGVSIDLPQQFFEPLLSQPYVRAPQNDTPHWANSFSSEPFDKQSLYQKATTLPVISNEVDIQDFKVIGQMFNTYIILEKADSVVFIDQHAAHERILYERYKKNFDIQHGTALLFPESFTVSPVAIQGLLRCKDFFERQGIAIDVLGADQIVVRSAPPMLKGTSLKELISQAASFIMEHESLEQSLFAQKINEHIHAQIACKSAVKAGDILTMLQMHQLIADLGQTPNRFICVHGRPTTWSIPKMDLEKKFKRT